MLPLDSGDACDYAALQARGLLNTVTGKVSGDAHLWQNVYNLQKQPQGRYMAPERQQPNPLAISVGSSYLTGSDEVVAWMRAKQQLRTPGSWRVKLRGKLQFPLKTQQVSMVLCTSVSTQQSSSLCSWPAVF